MNEKPVAWIKYLREHPEKQGRGRLHGSDDKMCCLGVYCWLNRDRMRVSREPGFGSVRYDGELNYLPHKMVYLGGFHNQNPGFRSSDGTIRQLSVLNDELVPWSEIADLIEAHWEEL